MSKLDPRKFDFDNEDLEFDEIMGKVNKNSLHMHQKKNSNFKMKDEFAKRPMKKMKKPRRVNKYEEYEG